MEAKIDQKLIPQLFEMGLMGIEIPERFGGAESSFFSAILAIEALATVDPSVSVMRGLSNNICARAEPSGARYSDSIATPIITITAGTMT